MTFDEVWQAIQIASSDTGFPIIGEISAQITEYHARPRRDRFDWESEEMYEESKYDDHGEHGFIQWMRGLLAGWASLPEQIPDVVFLAWRDGYTHHPADSTPVPILRCEDCLMVLPNAVPGGGFGEGWKTCPVCGGEKVAQANLGREPGVFLPAPKKKKPARR